MKVLEAMQDTLNAKKDNKDNEEYNNNNTISLNNLRDRDRGFIGGNGVKK